ncbi:MAG: flagellar hook-length control protein FliK [Synergistaceae bacterium]|jgi:hypothetical protein|nr:flagellar hook-length control protein FliK [Synergistaceae bacterium]
MQQGAFPIPAAAGSYKKYEKISAAPFKSPEDAGQNAEESLFASFMAVLTQDAEEPAKGDGASPALAEEPLELTLSVPQGERECRTDLLGLLSPLRTELEKEGIDLEALSEEMEGAMGEPGTELSEAGRLEAMLSVLRSRYLPAPRSGAARPDIGVSVSDGLKSGLEVFLKKNRIKNLTGAEDAEKSPAEDAVQEGAAQEEEIFSSLSSLIAPSTSSSTLLKADSEEPVFVNVNADANEGETAAQVPVVSRFHSYLKGRVSGASLKTETEEGGEPEERENSAQGGVSLLPFVVSEGMEGFRPEGSGSENPRPEGSSSGAKEAPLGLRKAGVRGEGLGDAFAQSAAEASSGKEPAAGPKRAAAEDRVNFEQFFEGILTARRGQSSSHAAGALELGSGTPLTRDEALREGLTNVVRFVRVSGEQKASLIVDPPALGRVSVELTGSAAGLEASIKVSSEQIRQLVQDQLTQLRWSLAQQGVQLTHFSVDVQQEDGGRRQQETGRGRRRAGGISRLEDDLPEQADFRVDLNEGLLYWVA